MHFRITSFLFFILLIFSSVRHLSAQELNCNVRVLTPQIQISDKQIFNTLESAIRDFMNNTKWTDDKYTPQEKIECSIVINVTEFSGSSFTASVTIQSSRPIYNTNINSVLLNHVDKDWSFEYTEFAPLIFNENTFSSSLTSMLAYYAFVIIGLDYDSFSLKGGNKYFSKAQTIVDNMQNQSYPGWTPSEGNRNRYWLVENLLNPNFEKFRNCLYQYHRFGLDKMYDDVSSGRVTILTSVTDLEEVRKNRPNSMILQLFFTAKSDELINVFSKAPVGEKNKAIDTFSRLDPSNASKYKKILSM